MEGGGLRMHWLNTPLKPAEMLSALHLCREQRLLTGGEAKRRRKKTILTTQCHGLKGASQASFGTYCPDLRQTNMSFFCAYRCIGSVFSPFFYLKLSWRNYADDFSRKFVELHVPTPVSTAKPIAVTRVSLICWWSDSSAHGRQKRCHDRQASIADRSPLSWP